MQFHIIDSDTHSFVPNTMTTSNCGLTVKFVPTSVNFDDERLCKECLRVHKSYNRNFTFVVTD